MLRTYVAENYEICVYVPYTFSCSFHVLFLNEIDCITTVRVKRYERCLFVHARTCGLNLAVRVSLTR
jgi:hypothetical protein